MKPSSGHLMELLEKLTVVEDQLRSQKLKFFQTEDLFIEETELWAKEMKAEKLKIHANEKGIKLKESELEEMTKECYQLSQASFLLKTEHKKLESEIQKAKLQQESEIKKSDEEEGALISALGKIEEEQKNLMKTNHWTRIFLDKEVTSPNEDTDLELNDDARKIITKEIAKRIEFLDKDLIEVVRSKVKSKQERLNELHENLFRLTKEYEEIDKKSQELEKQLQILDKS